jgi:hypothetical protein
MRHEVYLIAAKMIGPHFEIRKLKCQFVGKVALTAS